MLQKADFSMTDQLTIYSDHLFDNTDSTEFMALPASIRERCIRIRSIYTRANDFPFKKDSELVRYHMKMYPKVGRTQAYEDLRIAKTILGNVHAATKEYHRWKLIQMVEDSYNAAVASGDINARIKAADVYGKYNKLAVEDEMVVDWSRLPTQPFTITFDPSMLGLKPIANQRKVIDDTYAEFDKGDIVDVDFEEVDMNYDPFKRSPEDGGAPIED